MSESKTGRKAAAAAAAMNQGAKKVISEEQYVKNLRDDLASARYVAQEGARALLARFDRCVQDNVDLQVKLGEALIQSDRWREEAGKESEQMHEYAQQAANYGNQLDELAAFIIREVPGEPVESLSAVETAIKIIRGYLTKDKRNAEIAAAAPFADEVVAIDTTRADVIEEGLAPAEQGKDSIGG